MTTETTAMSEEKIVSWHLAPGNMRLNPAHGDDRAIVIGETLSVDGEISCCENGLHASIRPMDALQYRPSSKSLVFCKVEVWGDIDTENDKIAGRYRKVLGVVPPEQTLRVLVAWSAAVAQKALENERAAGREPDKRSWGAIEASQKWLNGDITTEELTTAASAARAAGAARAARAAADAADAADAAADAENNTLLEQMLEACLATELAVS